MLYFLFQTLLNKNQQQAQHLIILVRIVRAMNSNLTTSGSLKKQESPLQSPFHISNITLKPLELENYHNQAQRPKKLKYLPPNKIGYLSQTESRNPNTKMLPGLSIKNISAEDKNILQHKHRFKGLPVRRPLRNSRNSEILNSIIDILKTDPDKSMMPRNATHIKTQPSYLNQFMQMREISSVKNSRGPKILGNDVMFGTHQLNKRNLQSQEKCRDKKFGECSYSLSKKYNSRKTDPFDEMQMTFYKPGRKDDASYKSSQYAQKNQFMFE